MKKLKLFSLIVCALFATQMWAADETIFLWQYDGSSSYGGSNGVHDISGATTGTIKFVTYEGKTAAKEGTIGYNAAVTDSDLKPSITYGLKLGNNGAHMRITPNAGNFQAGDIIYICGYNAMLVTVSSDPTTTAKITTDENTVTVLASNLATGSGKGSYNVGTVTLPNSFVATNEIYISRQPSTSVGIAAIKVVRPAPAKAYTVTAATSTGDNTRGTVSSNESTLDEGEKATITAVPAEGYRVASWAVSGEGASIDPEGTSHSNTTTLTVGTANATVTVTFEPITVTGITITPSPATVRVDKTITLGATVTPANALDKAVTWSVKSGSTYASVVETTGVVTGLAVGTAVITATAHDGSGVTQDVTINVEECPTSGTIYTMSIAVAPLANCTITSTTGTHDLYQYEGVSGGEAILGNKGTSNNCILTTSKTIILKDDNSYLKLDFDCPLKEGDKIVYSVSSNNPVVSTGNSKPSTPLATLDRSKTEFVIPAESGLIDAQTIYIWKGGGNTTVTYINIVRPEKFAVTFNMHGHGDAVAAQYILDGGKVAEPATTDIEGWDFGGWYQTYVASPESYSDAWDFDNDVVSAATELHAKWTAHVASSDATLKALSVTGCTLNETFASATTEYTITLPLGSSMPAVGDVTATKNDSHAEDPIVSITDNEITIACEAEDGTKKNYTITVSYADIKDITLIWKPSTSTCGGGTVGSSTIKSDDASVSSYIKKITFTGGGTENASSSGSLNVGNTAGNMFTLSTQTGYKLESLNFHGKIQDADCEYSIDGGDWTTLTSTNTSGDACYEIFSSTEVTEFRLRSTGTSGVWIRNMQLTIKAIPYAITKAEMTNGSVTVKVGGEEVNTATIGQTVNLTASPVSGYKLASYSVYETATPANIITVTDGSFEMPAAAVTVSATFKAVYAVTLARGSEATKPGAATVSVDDAALTITTAPTGTGTLLGYYTAASDGTLVADKDGKLVDDNVTGFVTAGKWSLADDATLFAVYDGVPTALDNTVEETKAVKFIENGQVVIFKDGKYFNVLGIQIR